MLSRGGNAASLPWRVTGRDDSGVTARVVEYEGYWQRHARESSCEKGRGHACGPWKTDLGFSHGREASLEVGELGHEVLELMLSLEKKVEQHRN
eukprot:2210425-Rhodomonas_salina.3